MRDTYVYENLFFIEKNQVTVYHFLKEKKRFEYLKRDGTITYPITDDFWEWWKDAEDYVVESDKVDFCFVYDEENTLISDGFLEVIQWERENSCWDKKALSSFFSEMVNDSRIELHFSDGAVEKFTKPNIIFGENMQKHFYTNVELKSKRDTLAKSAEEIEKDDDVSPFSLYFKDLRRRQKNL